MNRRVVFGLCVFLLGANANAMEEQERDCKLSSAVEQMAELLLEHPEQQRKSLTCDPRLVAFAESRVRDMADRGYFGHVTPERKGPNELLRETGYVIPKYYVGGIANTVESILAGESEPEKVFRLLLESPPHRRHLLGEGETYVAQDRFGIAYLAKPESSHAHYWIVVIAENRREDRPMICTPAPAVCFVGPPRKRAE